MKKAISICLLQHRGKDWILLQFDPNTDWTRRIKAVPGRKWTETHRGWLVPDTPENRKLCKLAPIDNKTKIPFTKKPDTKPRTVKTSQEPRSELSHENNLALEKFLQELTLMAYSPSTIKTYRHEFMQLLKLLKKKPASELTIDELRRYMTYAMKEEGLNENSAHSRLNALKFYYEQVLKKEKFFWEIPRPKKPQQLPRMFSQSEISSIINKTDNLKHKVMLMLAYSAGLRVSEVVSLKTWQIDSKRRCIHVEHAKGKKDRITPLSPVLLVMLRKYASEYKPNPRGYLFEGQIKGMPYSKRSLQEVIGAAKEKASVIRPGSIHALRHSFATHLMEKGTDVTIIQKLLGHNDLKTTLRYLHATNKDILNIISPLDSLSLDTLP